MASQRFTPDEIRKAEAKVGRVKGVGACKISTDENGSVTEVHVVATSDKPARLIARDVETSLKVEMAMDVDHRKIGVVLFDSVEPPSTGGTETTSSAEQTTGARTDLPPRATAVVSEEPIPEFPVEEFASRFVFRSVNLFISPHGTRAEVELSRDDAVSYGMSESHRPGRAPFADIAEATLMAVSELLDEKSMLCLGDVRRVAIDDTHAIVAKVDLVTPRNRKSLAGVSVIAGNENQAVVFATLDAVNRVLGKLNFKSAVEYKIK
jgi:hypothetical protein